MDRSTRRFVTAVVVVAASCNVYDPSLLTGGGSSSGATGGSAATSGKSGSGGSSGEATNGGTGGGSGKGGASGGSAGSGSGAGGSSGSGKGGAGGTGGSGGSSGTDQMGGAGADAGGEAGIGASGGTGGTAGTGGGGKGGSAGTSGTGGGGKGGTGGAGAGGAGAGGAGAGGAGAGGAGAGGTGGAATATGCAKLTTALNESTDVAHFVITLPQTATDLTGKTMTVRTYVQAGSGGSIKLYVQSGPSASPAYGWAFSAATALSGTGTWKDITFAPPSGNSTTNAYRLGIEVTAAPATSGWTASTIVFVDSVTVNTTTPISYTFDATGTVYTTQTTADQVDKIWINNSDADTPSQTRSGTTVAWVATCP